MIAEGRLLLQIGWNGKRVTAASVRSTRPVDACRVLEGKAVEDALRLIPLLFSVCARAQSVAASVACEAAAGATASLPLRRQRERGIAAECLQEYAWRQLIDLPGLLGESPRPHELGQLRMGLARAGGDADWNAVATFAEELLAERIFGVRPEIWLAWSAARLEAWIDAGGQPAARMLRRMRRLRLGAEGRRLPWLAAADLRDGIGPLVAGTGWTAAPTWQGRAAETGAWARQACHARVASEGAGASARVLARLVELTELPRQMRMPRAVGVRCAALGAGRGIAAVETARGTLVHDVVLERGRIARYRIAAPTEWNFHPLGAFPRGMLGRTARDAGEVREAAALLAHALDPCVAYDVEVRHHA